MQSKVLKWGDDLAILISTEFAAIVGLEENSEVDLSIVDGKLVIVPSDPAKRRPTLDDLLALVTDDNLHGEIDTGTPVGNEVW